MRLVLLWLLLSLLLLLLLLLLFLLQLLWNEPHNVPTETQN